MCEIYLPHGGIDIRDWILYVYVMDRRCGTGERLIGTYPYPSKDASWMKEEVSDLQFNLYPTSKYRLVCEQL